MGQVAISRLDIGTLDWDRLFRVLAAVRYAGPLIIESPYRGDLQVLVEGRAFVQSLLVSGA
jgi:sugar phosphate isomerase/epimerase